MKELVYNEHRQWDGFLCMIGWAVQMNNSTMTKPVKSVKSGHKDYKDNEKTVKQNHSKIRVKLEHKSGD